MVHFSGVRSVDLARGVVVFGAGTRLHDLPRLLGPYLLAFPVLGDVDTQTLAGAVSTGTHGTGACFTGLASQVLALRIVLADGTVVTCDADQRPELFQAARVGLGVFGVITEMTLQCVPAFLLAAVEYPEPLDAVLENFGERMSAADHVEFYWFPHTDVALVKANSRLPLGAGRLPLARWRGFCEDELVNNGVFGLTCAVGSVVPAVVPMMNRMATRSSSTDTVGLLMRL